MLLLHQNSHKEEEIIDFNSNHLLSSLSYCHYGKRLSTQYKTLRKGILIPVVFSILYSYGDTSLLFQKR
ncbi:hypothetical protein DJ468_00145 [Candidatus Liberibacter asiaticus]|nr:hypothetical protein DJ468_00145 [Candidatus Liberibacter asiaticus]